MWEPVTLEFLSKQCDRMLAEMEAMRDEMRKTRETLRRCIATAEEIHQLMDECLGVMKEYTDTLD